MSGRVVADDEVLYFAFAFQFISCTSYSTRDVTVVVVAINLSISDVYYKKFVNVIISLMLEYSLIIALWRQWKVMPNVLSEIFD